MANASDNDGKALIDRLGKLEGDKRTVAALWEEIRKIVLPESAPNIGYETPGTRGRSMVFDETPEQANETLAAGIYGITTNPATAWVGITTDDHALNEDPVDGGWLEAASGRLLADFQSELGGFALTQPEFIAEICTLGTATKYIWPDQYGRPMFQHCPASAMNIAENKAGRVDTWFRDIDWTARQAMQEFGVEAPAKLREMAEKKPDQMVRIVHAVLPNEDQRPGRIDPDSLPWMSWYIWKEERQTIRRRGQHESRYVTSRWSKRRGVTDTAAPMADVWGRGPGHKALPSARMLQEIMKDTLRSLQNSIRPPLMIADDGVLGPIRLTPGALNPVRRDGRHPPIERIDLGSRPDIGEDFMESIRKRIRESFYHSQMLAVRQFLQAYSKPPTKAEVLALKEEELRVLGPIVGRIVVEDLMPTINIVYSMGQRAGRYPEMPPRLRELPEFKLEFDNPITQAQRVMWGNAVVSTLDVMNPLIAAKPHVLDNVDEDATFRRVADGFGWPKGTLRSVDQVAEIRARDAEAAQGRAAIEEAGGMAAAAKDAAAAASMGAGL